MEEERVHRVDSNQLLKQLEAAPDEKSLSHVWVVPRSPATNLVSHHSCAEDFWIKNNMQEIGRMNYLKTLPSVMAAIFLSSSTIAWISCNSCTLIYLSIRDQSSIKSWILLLVCNGLYSYMGTLSMAAPFPRSLSKAFLASSTFPPWASHLVKSMYIQCTMGQAQ